MKKYVFLFLSAIIAFSSCGPKGRIEAGPVEILPLPPIGFIQELYVVDSTQVRSGDSFTALMNRLGLGATDAYTLTQRCEGTFDVRKLRAGNKIQAYYAPASEGSRSLQYVVYQEDRIRSYVFRCADSLSVWKVDKPVEHRRGFVDVTINSSLWNDMMAAGVIDDEQGDGDDLDHMEDDVIVHEHQGNETQEDGHEHHHLVDEALVVSPSAHGDDRVYFSAEVHLRIGC